MNFFAKTAISLIAAAGMAACGNACGERPAAEPAESQNISEAVIDNIMSRRSIRKYTDEQVPRQTLDKIIECGLNAPNARNAQEYEVRVVSDSASIAFLHENFRGLYNAPAYVFMAAEALSPSSLMNLGLMSENMALAAWSLGIGSVNLGGPVPAIRENADVMEKLNFSAGYELSLILALGYPDEAPEAKPRDQEKAKYVEL